MSSGSLQQAYQPTYGPHINQLTVPKPILGNQLTAPTHLSPSGISQPVVYSPRRVSMSRLRSKSLAHPEQSNLNKSNAQKFVKICR